ncbi:MAG: isochorismate synthase [Myxococcota bacterium]|nr:isochorismate synthase [Myxococcota bacterium]
MNTQTQPQTIPTQTPGRAELETAVIDAAKTADQIGSPQFVSCRIALDRCDLLAFFEEASAGEHRFYWAQPARQQALASLGAEATIEAKGAGRFEEAWRAVADIGAATHLGPGTPAEGGPLFVGGFAFADGAHVGGVWHSFPTARLVLPRVLLKQHVGGHEAWVTQRVAPGAALSELTDRWEASVSEAVQQAAQVWHRVPEVRAESEEGFEPFQQGDVYAVVADRSHDLYRGQVAAALRAIAAGAFEKVVLARALDVRHPGRFDVEAFLHTLKEIYPHCTTLAVSHGEDTVVAASPELLLRRHAGRVETCALAGSARRGRSPEEDDALAQALHQSQKERAEHEAVVRSIREALAPVCSNLMGPEEPELMRVEGIQHLSTPLTGEVAGGVDGPSVLELAARLHPTAAVGGLPVREAGRWIDEKEGLARGWYAGPVGWLDAAGNGEWWLALRSALIQNTTEPNGVSQARLFAGAGIVAGSDPDLELRETRLKLRALLAPLTEI